MTENECRTSVRATKADIEIRHKASAVKFLQSAISKDFTHQPKFAAIPRTHTHTHNEGRVYSDYT